jgi:hypothetical protein
MNNSTIFANDQGIFADSLPGPVTLSISDSQINVSNNSAVSAIEGILVGQATVTINNTQIQVDGAGFATG